MRNQQAIKLFLVLLTSTAYIFCFSHFGVLAYDSINNDQSIADGQGSEELSAIGKSTLELVEDQSDIDRFVDKSIVLDGKTQFSLLRFIKEQELEDVSALSLNILATLIYEVVLPTNFSINERHISKSLPDYATLGFEARINLESDLDLLLTNPNDSRYLIRFEKNSGVLSASLLGPNFSNSYAISTQDKEILEPKVIKEYVPQLEKDEMEVKNEGQEGQSVKVYRETYSDKGEQLETELISEDIYSPVHKIELYGLDSPESSSSVGRSDEDLNTEKKAGDNETSGKEEADWPSQQTGENDLWGIPNEIPKN